jgi:hypothetical protein
MREELQEVFDAVLDAADEKQIDRRELAKMFLKAVGLTGFVRTKPDLSAQEYVDLRWLIHETLGAPGDWGYHTRLGKALQKLYGATPPADAAQPAAEVVEFDPAEADTEEGRAGEIAQTVEAVESGNLGEGIQIPVAGGDALPPVARRFVPCRTYLDGRRLYEIADQLCEWRDNSAYTHIIPADWQAASGQFMASTSGHDLQAFLLDLSLLFPWALNELVSRKLFADTPTAMEHIRDWLQFRISQKGLLSLASMHEVYGVVAKELLEVASLLDDLDDGEAISTEDLTHELKDVAVAVCFGVASLEALDSAGKGGA